MSVQIKSFLSTEGKRNRANADLYLSILQIAYPGEVLDVIVGHHICFEFDKDIATENEIPAADTLLFDHEIMGRVFGKDKALAHMVHMVKLDAGQREDYIRLEVNRIKARGDDARRNAEWQEAPQYDGPTSLDV
jgi:hypothetical protein